MQYIKAEQRFVRQSARKVRVVADAVRDLTLMAAIQQLSVMDMRASQVVLKVMRQAVANAQNNLQLNPNDLTIDTIIINEGPQYKRFRAVSRGRAHSILKRTCHVKVVLKTDSSVIATPTKKADKKEAKIVDSTATVETGIQNKQTGRVKADKKVQAKTAQTAKQPKVSARTTSK